MLNTLFVILLPAFTVLSLRMPDTALLFWLIVSPFSLAPLFPMPDLVPDITLDMVAALLIGLGFVLRGEYRRLVGSASSTGRWMGVFCLVLVVELPLFFRPKDMSMQFLTIAHAFVFPFMFYLMTRYLLTRDGVFNHLLASRIVNCMMIVAFVVSVMGIYEGLTWQDLLAAPASAFSEAHGGGLRAATGFARVNGPYWNPETYGVVVALFLFLVLLKRDLRSGRDSRGRSGIGLVLLALLVTALAFNLFRSIWLAVGAALVVRFLILPGRRLGIFVALALVGLTVAFAWPLLGGSRVFVERINQSQTFHSRVGSYLYAGRAAASSPFIGVGFGRMPKYIEHGVEAGDVLMYRGVLPARSVHNAFLCLLAENGILGLIPFLMILFSLYSFARSHIIINHDRAELPYVAAFLSILVVYTVPMFLDRIIYDGKLNNIVFCLMGLLTARLEARKEDTSLSRKGLDSSPPFTEALNLG